MPPCKPSKPPTQAQRDRSLPIAVQAREYLADMMGYSEDEIDEDISQEWGAEQLLRHLTQFGRRIDNAGAKQPDEVATRKVRKFDTSEGPF